MTDPDFTALKFERLDPKRLPATEHRLRAREDMMAREHGWMEFDKDPAERVILIRAGIVDKIAFSITGTADGYVECALARVKGHTPPGVGQIVAFFRWWGIKSLAPLAHSPGDPSRYFCLRRADDDE